MSNSVTHITDAEFTSTVAEGVTLVDFWATWCGPCRTIAPILDELAEEYKGKLRIVKIDVDNNPVVAQDHGIASIPTLLLFKDGKKVGQKIGAQSKKALIDFIDQA